MDGQDQAKTLQDALTLDFILNISRSFGSLKSEKKGDMIRCSFIMLTTEWRLGWGLGGQGGGLT